MTERQYLTHPRQIDALFSKSGTFQAAPFRQKQTSAWIGILPSVRQLLLFVNVLNSMPTRIYSRFKVIEMKETIDAIYENGIIRPLRKLTLSDGLRIRVTLDTKAEDTEQALESETDVAMSKKLTGLAGSLKDSPRFSSDPLLIQKMLRDEWN